MAKTLLAKTVVTKKVALKSSADPVLKSPLVVTTKVVKIAAKAAKPAVKAPTITLRHLALELAAAHNLPKKQANLLLVELCERITKHLVKGNKIRLSGLGILQVKKRPARMGRNPATGAAIKIKASKKIAFRAAKELKEAV